MNTAAPFDATPDRTTPSDTITGKAVAWKNGVWLSPAQATLTLDDLGFVQGVVVVDRLRTINGLPLDVSLHIERWRAGCAALEFTLPRAAELEQLVQQLVVRNRSHFPDEDFSIVAIATPGQLHDQPRRPTIILYPQRIEWPKLVAWYRNGQQLQSAAQCCVPNECWPAAIKTRARLNYYLADRQAAARHADPTAAGVLHSRTGGARTLTETSVANFLIVEQDGTGMRLISPPLDQILNGISLQRTLRIAAQLGLETCFESISIERAEAAAEIILCGTSGCIWAAARFNQRVFHDPARQAGHMALLEGWRRELQFDFIAAAEGLCAPPRR